MMDTELDIASEYEALVQFMYLAPIGLAQTAMDGEIAMVNPLLAQLLMPLSRDGNLANLFTTLETVAPELRNLVSEFAAPYGMVCDALRIQVNAGVPGKTDPHMLSLSLLKLDASRLMAVLKNVTLEVKRERQLKQNEAWFNAILTGVTDYALVSLDAQGQVTEWNSSIGRVTGFSSDAVLGQSFSVFYPVDAMTPDRLLDRLREADDNGWSMDDGWRLKADGSRFWGSAMLAPLREPQRDSQGDGSHLSYKPLGLRLAGEPAYCLVIRDISDQREANEKLRQANACDHLTGIANRRAFFEAAERELDRAQRSPRPVSLILFDVDHFKQVNDTYGHPAGDAVLRHLAELLTATFRPLDVVARVGGEEFAVLLPSTDLVVATAVANRLREAVAAQTVLVDGHAIRYALSGGVAVAHDAALGLDILMKKADRALYAAKATGRNRIATEESL